MDPLILIELKTVVVYDQQMCSKVDNRVQKASREIIISAGLRGSFMNLLTVLVIVFNLDFNILLFHLLLTFQDMLVVCWSYCKEDRPSFSQLLKTMERLPRKPFTRSPSHPIHLLSRSADSLHTS